MKQLVIAPVLVLALVASLASTARAGDDDDALYQCHAVGKDTKMRVSLAPGATLRDLTVWLAGFTCKTVIYSADVEARASTLTVVTPTELTPKQGIALFRDAVEALGLVIVQHADTFIIKLGKVGPGAASACSAYPLPPQHPAVDPPLVEGTAPTLVAPEPDLDAGIHAVDATHATVTRALVDQLLANPMVIAKGARVVAAMKDGKTDGFKVYAIKPGSVYARIGLVNGDTVRKINGMPLDSADKALEAYTALRAATELDVDVLRRGKPVTLVITVQ